MIDLAKLELAAAAPDGSVKVSSSWLKQVLAELSECRAAGARPRCFGLKPDQTI